MSAEGPICTVSVLDHGGVCEVVLSRPHVLNALDSAMRDELVAVLSAAWVGGQGVVLRGQGEGFCSGGDLNEFGLQKDTARAHMIRQLRSVAWCVWRIHNRFAVAIHGACHGAGLELAAFARRVICDESARFCLPELGFGLIPGSGGTISVPRRIGRHRALELCLTGRAVDAEEALSIGLVDEVVARDELRNAAIVVARGWTSGR